MGWLAVSFGPERDETTIHRFLNPVFSAQQRRNVG